MAELANDYLDNLALIDDDHFASPCMVCDATIPMRTTNYSLVSCGHRWGSVCDDCAKTNIADIRKRLASKSETNSSMSTAECECPVCEEREEQERREAAKAVRRTDAAHVASLFRKRRELKSCLEAAERVASTGTAELKLIPMVICHAGRELDSEIERLADDMPEEHADLAEATHLLLRVVQNGGGVKYEDSTCDDRVVLSADLHALDSDAWQRLFALRDVLAEFSDDQPQRSCRNAAGCPNDDIPF